jgi:hypothetical protein
LQVPRPPLSAFPQTPQQQSALREQESPRCAQYPPEQTRVLPWHESIQKGTPQQSTPIAHVAPTGEQPESRASTASVASVASAVASPLTSSSAASGAPTVAASEAPISSLDGASLEPESLGPVALAPPQLLGPATQAKTDATTPNVRETTL